MATGFEALTEKEKQTLRLLLVGHDAKSMARHLELSVHTINERLRDARRKLSASSSREAARLLREAEGAHPDSAGDKQIGDAPAARAGQQGGEPIGRPIAGRRAAWAIGGIAMLSFALAAVALSAPEAVHDRSAAPAAQAATPAESPVTAAARQWLALVDAGDWQQSWATTGKSFQSMNTVKVWEKASLSARVPLGRVVSRTLVGEENIPAPPHGYQLVRFRTDFANKPGATETLSLNREGESWRVVGYFIE